MNTGPDTDGPDLDGLFGALDAIDALRGVIFDGEEYR
jgi:hypothetical protein